MLMLGGILLVIAVVGLVLEPLIRGRTASLQRENDEMTEAEATRRVKLLALRDTDYDYEMGKLDEADYRSLRSQLSAEALAAMKDVETERAGVDAEADLEAQIAAVRAGMRSGTVCTDCGHRNPLGSRFCGGCGTALQASTASGT